MNEKPADRWAGEECTLDGKPARIQGRKNDFATVAALDGPAYEWAWEAVDRIMRAAKTSRANETPQEGMMNAIKEMAEQGTGCREHPKGFGQLYGDGGVKLTLAEAKRLFKKGEVIEAPNAGAGTYQKLLAAFGYKRVEVIDWTSSAGDWTFAVNTKGGWRPVSQSNRHPRCGFAYVLCDTPVPFGTFRELCDGSMDSTLQSSAQAACSSFIDTRLGPCVPGSSSLKQSKITARPASGPSPAHRRSGGGRR